MLKIMVPATTANIGPGFDCLGMALELYNTLEIASSDEGTHIQVYGEGADRLPCSENNLIYRALARYYEEINSPPPAPPAKDDQWDSPGPGVGELSRRHCGRLTGRPSADGTSPAPGKGPRPGRGTGRSSRQCGAGPPRRPGNLCCQKRRSRLPLSAASAAQGAAGSSLYSRFPGGDGRCPEGAALPGSLFRCRPQPGAGSSPFRRL